MKYHDNVFPDIVNLMADWLPDAVSPGCPTQTKPVCCAAPCTTTTILGTKLNVFQQNLPQIETAAMGLATMLGFVISLLTGMVEGAIAFGTAVSDNWSWIGPIVYGIVAALGAYVAVLTVYNENKETGKREIYIAQDGANINQWGVLQYYEKIDSTANAKSMADALLDLYNTKTRTLKLQSVLGDIRVRGGTLLVVTLGLGDINLSSYLMVEQVKHTFNNEQHLMDMKMRGGTFVA